MIGKKGRSFLTEIIIQGHRKYKEQLKKAKVAIFCDGNLSENHMRLVGDMIHHAANANIFELEMTYESARKQLKE